MTAWSPVRGMQRALVRGVELEYEVRGEGEPILLVHGSHIANSFVTFMSQRVLTDEFALIRYHRRGYQGSSSVIGSFSIADQAADAAALIEHLGMGPAHVVGHSYGGAIAMQMAVDFPEQTSSLILLEAALLTVEGGQAALDLIDVAQGLYRRGNWEAAVDLLLGSPAERTDVSRNVPGGLDAAIRDVDTYFAVEARAHERWHFDAASGAKLRGPIFYLMGGNSNELYRTVFTQISQWAPQIESGVVDRASHLLHMQQPAEAAAHVAAFCRRHPIRAGAAAVRRDRLERRYNATVDILEGNLRAGRGAHVAIVAPDREWTYAEVSEVTNRVGNALRGLGVEMEDRVLMVMADSVEFATTFFAAMKLGAIPVPVSTSLAGEDYSLLLEETRAKVLIVDQGYLRWVREALGHSEHLRQVVIVGHAEDEELSFGDIVAAASSDLVAAHTTRDDAAFWVYGLGVDGRPHGVIHLHGSLRACAEGFGRQVLSLGRQDRTFCSAKLSHPYGLGADLYLPFAVGASCVLAPEPRLTRMVLHTLRTHRPTVFFGAPSTFAGLLDAGRSRKGDEFSTLRLCVSAGEPLSPRLARRWEAETGVELIDGLGLPETCHVFLSSSPGPNRAGEEGAWRQRVVPGFELCILDERQQPVPTGEVGRLLVRGQALFAGYWLAPQATMTSMHGGWFDTGSMYSVDENGCYTPRDRPGGVYKVAGTWVSAMEVEQVVGASMWVADCAVFTRPDASDVLQLEALIVPRGDRDAWDVAAALRRSVRIRLGGAKTPRHFHFVDALPRHDDGRLRREDLARMVEPAPEVQVPTTADRLIIA